MKILIIQDNIQLAELTRMYLVNNGYEVIVCKDAWDGINHVSQYQPHLILIDFYMPVFNGPEIIQYLKMDKKFKDIPVVFLDSPMTEDGKDLQKDVFVVDGVKYPILFRHNLKC